MIDVRAHLARKPLLFDGGMGTYYKAKPGTECEQGNLLDPAGVRKVHREYLAAGAEAIKTNTFGLPRMAAAQQPDWQALARAGWKLAAEAAVETGAAVFADLGPAPDTEAAPAGSIYTAVARCFVEQGAKNFLFETLSSDAGVLEAVQAVKAQVPDAFVLVSFAVLPDGYTREGMYSKDLVRRMTESGIVDAVGFNCVSAPGAMRTLVQQLGSTALPLSVMPNAGYPVVTRTQVKYQGKPEYFAKELARIAAEGVRILGGCCGTTPAHIAALRAALDSLPAVEKAAPAVQVSTPEAPTVEKDDAFLRKLNAGKKVIAIELDSPKDADLTNYLAGAKRLQAAGADLLTIADCPIARARMDSSLVACRVHRELGLCTLPHMTCRDRNLNATKALLLGLYAEGVREVLAITGDPIPTAERDEVKNVYQFNSRKLAQYIVSLAGEGREMPSPMTVGPLGAGRGEPPPHPGDAGRAGKNSGRHHAGGQPAERDLYGERSQRHPCGRGYHRSLCRPRPGAGRGTGPGDLPQDGPGGPALCGRFLSDDAVQPGGADGAADRPAEDRTIAGTIKKQLTNRTKTAIIFYNKCDEKECALQSAFPESRGR